jgi:hypothetical protein
MPDTDFDTEIKEKFAEQRAALDVDIPEEVDDTPTPIDYAASFMDDVPEETPEETPEEVPEEPAEELPEGFQSYEEYIEAGRDPKFYRGIEAYKKQQELIASQKELKEMNRTLNDTMFQFQKFQEEQRETEQRKLLQEKQFLENKLAEARSELDFDKHDAISNRLNDVNDRIAEPPQENSEPKVISNARQQDPRINPAHPDFDADFHAIVRERVNASLVTASNAVGRALTDNEVLEHFNAAVKAAESKFKPATPTRPAEVASPRAVPTKEKSNVPPEIKAQITKWSKSNNADEREAAEAWKIKYNIK